MKTEKKSARRGRAKVRPATAHYFKLVRTFPLRRIRSDEELAAALEVVQSLMTAELDEGAADYLDMLTEAVEKYERKAHPIPDASEGDMLLFLMENRRLSQSELARQTGIVQSTISAVVKGARQLTRDQITTLAGYFKVSPLVFLPEGNEG
jgi:HTH-type transcriptional regulator/antitoxin HigA